MRRRIITVVLAALVVGLGLWVFWNRHAAPEMRPGEIIKLPSIKAELLFLDASSIVKRGSPRVLVVRFGAAAEFVPYHFRSSALDGPKTVEEWAPALGRPPVIFNAGQFDDKLDYLGWLKRDGQWLSAQRKSPWKGLLVSGPLDGAAWARIADLDIAPAEVVDRYRHVVQSMMLLDAERKLRVRDTDLSACRTVVAEDMRGRILVMVTEGATTLGDLARWLPTTELGIVRAMNLDGGIESQLYIDTPEYKLVLYGQHGTGATMWEAGPGPVHYPLPAVVAVRAAATEEPTGALKD